MVKDERNKERGIWKHTTKIHEIGFVVPKLNYDHDKNQTCNGSYGDSDEGTE